MNLRKITFVALTAALALAVTSCGTARRAGKDASIALLSPIIVPYGGFTDGFAASQDVAEGLDAGVATQVIAMPFTTTYHVLKHGVLAFLHLGDFLLCPIYGAADLHPSGPEIQPLDYYTGTWFDDPNWGQSGSTDPESGQDG
ncbi:MAG: hypothetical protein AAF628_32830 [Planctomycetota bacterium]